MNYSILKNNNDEFFIEISRNTFKTRIVLDFTPDTNFSGVAVCCNYSFKGHPLGFLKDNGLVISNIAGKNNRPIFYIDDTVIQAGPMLIENFEKNKYKEDENFSFHDLSTGVHVHMGQKKLGNYVLGFTKTLTMLKIRQKYKDMNVQQAIKLPGLNQAGFYFKSSHQTISVGDFPFPAALIFESKNKDSKMLNEIDVIDD